MAFVSPRSTKGFTLIELLVVIAIIGILSAVVLAALYIARLKGADAAIKSDLHVIQTQMELYYDNSNGGSYGVTPYLSVQPVPRTTIGVTAPYGTDPQIKNALQGAINQSNGVGGCWSIGAGGASYAVAFPLQADSTKWWCVDASGSARAVSSDTFSGSCKGGGNTQMAGGPVASASCPP
ncbi:MAG: hypothetical protein JWO84_626 [Parcubacteria group bacterium]|nr:hypothetical protein [Parcubacteria group bacterium]